MNNRFEFNKAIGKQIRYFRIRRCMSQLDLAKALGIPRPGISNMEQGLRTVNVQELIAIANHMHINIERFFPENSYLPQDIWSKSEYIQ